MANDHRKLYNIDLQKGQLLHTTSSPTSSTHPDAAVKPTKPTKQPPVLLLQMWKEAAEVGAAAVQDTAEGGTVGTTVDGTGDDVSQTSAAATATAGQSAELQSATVQPPSDYVAGPPRVGLEQCKSHPLVAKVLLRLAKHHAAVPTVKLRSNTSPVCKDGRYCAVCCVLCRAVCCVQ